MIGLFQLLNRQKSGQVAASGHGVFSEFHVRCGNEPVPVRVPNGYTCLVERASLPEHRTFARFFVELAPSWSSVIRVEVRGDAPLVKRNLLLVGCV